VYRLIAESARVSDRLVIIKDHKVDGLWAHPRIALIDWAANVPYGVPCRFRYNTLDEWRSSHRRHGLVTEGELTSMRLYPPVVSLLFQEGVSHQPSGRRQDDRVPWYRRPRRNHDEPDVRLVLRGSRLCRVPGHPPSVLDVNKTP
jgi:hypothetical protein